MTIVLTACLRMPGRRFRLGAEGGLSDGRDGLSFLCILDSYYIWFEHCSALFNHMKSPLVLVNLMNSLLLISQYGQRIIPIPVSRWAHQIIIILTGMWYGVSNSSLSSSMEHGLLVQHPQLLQIPNIRVHLRIPPSRVLPTHVRQPTGTDGSVSAYPTPSVSLVMSVRY